ncbi:MAG: PAS domain S-box protein [Methanoregulaceae archaeon]
MRYQENQAIQGGHYKDLLWISMILATTVLAILAQLLGLSRGIIDIYPFLYLFPLIIVAYAYPSRGVLFTLVMSWVYIGLVYVNGNFTLQNLAVSTVWFVVYITIGIVISSYAESWRTEEKRYKGIFENSQAGTLTVELGNRTISNLNDTCASMLGYERGALKGAPVDQMWANAGDLESFLYLIGKERRIADREVRLKHRDGSLRWALLSAGKMPWNTAILSVVDITARKEAEEELRRLYAELEQRILARTADLNIANESLKREIAERTRAEQKTGIANRKLTMLSSITRHDILNQVSAMVLYLSLLEETCTDQECLDYTHKIMNLTQLIQKQIGFTRDYREVGADVPLWQNLQAVIRKAAGMIDLGQIRIAVNIRDTEVYADPMFEKVMYNLFDNAIRHGGHVTTIAFSAKVSTEGNLIVSCEDNGAGVPDRVKESIFRREYYKNTGYGLFLSREILAMTDLSIRETGTLGTGARFEITVPPGRFRCSTENPTV